MAPIEIPAFAPLDNPPPLPPPDVGEDDEVDVEVGELVGADVDAGLAMEVCEEVVDVGVGWEMVIIAQLLRRGVEGRYILLR